MDWRGARDDRDESAISGRQFEPQKNLNENQSTNAH